MGYQKINYPNHIAENVQPTGTFDLVLDGFEGPIDVLLSLAREQKVDLSRISVLALVEQYVAFIEKLQQANLELAADYLVMAAWLVYLKSRLLLPDPPREDEPSGAEIAADLSFRLQRLEAIRKLGSDLMARPRLGKEIFARGAPDDVKETIHMVFKADLPHLLSAYAGLHMRGHEAKLHIEPHDLFSPDEAIRRLENVLGKMPDWSVLSSFLPTGMGGLLKRSAIASHLVAVLELCRQGKVELRQDGGRFNPLMIRRKSQEIISS